MNLGSILSGDTGEPCVADLIEFYLMRQTSQGRQRFRIQAALLPISAADRQAARRDALNFLRTLPEYQEREDADSGLKVAPPIPSQVLDAEFVTRLLVYALHQPDNLIAKLVSGPDYALFRQGLTTEQITWMHGRYDKYLRTQYPELIPPETMADLEQQAAGK